MLSRHAINYIVGTLLFMGLMWILVDARNCSCAKVEFEETAIEEGMSMDEVRDILGAPELIYSEGNPAEVGDMAPEHWQYRTVKGPKTQIINVTFENGVVTHIERH